MLVGVILEWSKILFLVAESPPEKFRLEDEAVIGGDIFLIMFIGIINSVFASFLEEFIFRFLPFKVWGKWLRPIPYWLMGFFTSLVFALAHTNIRNGFEFPLIQFISGLYFWSLIRYEKGYWLATISHLVQNLTMYVALALASLIYYK